ncbi:MAG: UbiD family decarboxylase [Dehalococcoidales bacterium]|nr:UbiD family decarboxylase [Dehalococcoidales bacterium]
MPYEDLREFLTDLRERGQLVQVDRSVSPHLELSLITKELNDRQGPAVLFTNVQGSPLPVVTNLFPSRERAAMALGVGVDDMRDRWIEAMRAPLEPVTVDRAACKEIIRDSAALTQIIPQIVWHERDGGPYLPFGLCICKDPDTGRRNMAIYRIHMKGGNKVGMKLQPPQHGGVCYAKAEARGEPLQIAIAIGGDPALYIASQAVTGFGVDEIGLAGRLRGAPVELVKCETVDLEVPAGAEIVLEGRVLPGVREAEGPFGEFQGYYSGASMRQVVEFTAITHRRDPIYLATYEGRPPTNTHVLQAIAREPRYFTQIRDYVCPTVKDVYVTLGGAACYHVWVSIHQQAAGQAKNVALELLKSHLVKHVIVVDDDIDVRDPLQMEWVLATRVQADRDVLILPGMASQHLDPSQPAHPSGLGCKMAIDATIPYGHDYDKVEFSPDLVERVRANWGAYGLR